MSDAKFTPGPWNVVNFGDIYTDLGAASGDGSTADSNDGWHIAEIGSHHTSVDGEEVELGHEVQKANAHLIAAAPDMYEALQALARGEGLKPGTTIEGLLEKAEGKS